MSDTTGGRHSANDQTSFYRSAILWFLPWVVVGVVAIGALWIAIDTLSNDDSSSAHGPSDKGKAAAVAPSPEEEPSAEPSEIEEEPTDEPTEVDVDTGTPDEEKEKKGKSGDVELITDGISVQILNGTSDSEVDDGWADKLEGLGFEIAAVNPYLDLGDTAVYWSNDESQDAAKALGDKFGWPTEPKPNELSSEVDLHIYLGDDAL
jgi:LytR cell envelope-related transcriptional attenuator